MGDSCSNRKPSSPVLSARQRAGLSGVYSENAATSTRRARHNEYQQNDASTIARNEVLTNQAQRPRRANRKLKQKRKGVVRWSAWLGDEYAKSKWPINRRPRVCPRLRDGRLHRGTEGERIKSRARCKMHRLQNCVGGRDERRGYMR